MALEMTTGVPCKIQAGDAIAFQVQDADHPASLWESRIYFGRGGTPISNAAGSANGNFHEFILNGTVTNGLMGAMGKNTVQAIVRFTESANNANVESGCSRSIVIIPNLAAAQTASVAQTLLTQLETAIAQLNGDSFQSVSFNGQSYSKASLGDLIRQRNILKAEVIREQQAAANAAGEFDGSTYQYRFHR